MDESTTMNQQNGDSDDNDNNTEIIRRDEDIEESSSSATLQNISSQHTDCNNNDNNIIESAQVSTNEVRIDRLNQSDVAASPNWMTSNTKNDNNSSSSSRSRRLTDDDDQNPTNTVTVSSRTNQAPPIKAFMHLGAVQKHDAAIDNDNRKCTYQQDTSSNYHHRNHHHRNHHATVEPQGEHTRTDGSVLFNDDDDDELTSSLLTQEQQQPQQQQDQPASFSFPESFLDRLHEVYSHVRQVVLDPETYERIQRTIRSSGNYIATSTLFVMLVLVPAVLYNSLTDRKLDIAAIHSARVMVIGTVIMSLRLVYLHLTHWFMPDVQKYVVRILWMVPIYAIQSYLSLRYHHARVYMSTIRDFYEAFVITSFVYYLMELLGGQEALVLILQRKDPRCGHHQFPMSLVLQPWIMGEEFMLQCKHGVLQFVVFKTTATVLIFLCEYCGVYGEGHFEWFVAYPYLCFFQNISVMYALYCLVIFFHVCNEELRHPVNWYPLGKFLCIKGVVFLTWWQGVIIFYLRDHGFIGPMGPWSSIDVANGFIDYCIVVEMVFFAIAHSYTFTYIEYLPGRFPQPDESRTNEHDMEHEFSRALLTNPDTCIRHQRMQQYRPPATLPEPMRFRDALWSSTVPHETLQDIQRLRAGVVESRAISRGISLSAMNNNGDDDEVTVDRRVDPESEHPKPESEAEVSVV
jgi:Organic solute transporter Ostalpha